MSDGPSGRDELDPATRHIAEPGDEDRLTLTDDYVAMTIPGVPYGVIDAADLFDDLGQRIAVWCAAHAGPDGIGRSNLEDMTSQTMAHFVAVMDDVRLIESFRGVRLLSEDSDDPRP